MKKKSQKSVPKKKGGLRKFGHITLLASALIVGVVFAQNGFNSQLKETSPKIDSISPDPLIPNKEFTITDSGFTTEAEYKSKKRTSADDKPVYTQRDVIADYPGNFYRIKGALTGTPPVFSADGKTLKFSSLDLSVRELSENCLPGTMEKICQLPIQVINAYGVASNTKQVKVLLPSVLVPQ